MRDHVFHFDFQPGWVDLLLDEEGDWVEAWAAATAALTEFKSADLEVKERKLIRDLRRRALTLNRDEPLIASVYCTPAGKPLADFRLDTYDDDGAPRPSPSEVVPLLLDFSDADVVGEPDIRYLDLDAGAAVRVQGTLKLKKSRFGFGGGQRADIIKYAVFPPDVDYLAVVWVTCRDRADVDEVVRLTDELVATMRLVPVDAVDSDGNEVRSAD